MQVSLEDITNAIYGQESGHGKADTSKANYAGARGPMQVTLDTFNGMKRNGMIPAEYDHANPEHTMAAGKALVGHLYNKYGGDGSKVAAAYYAGEKAVNADGTINDYRDRKNSKAPTVLQYVSQVLGRVGGTFEPPAVVKATPVERPDVLAAWDKPMPEPMTKAPTRMAASEGLNPLPVLAAPAAAGDMVAARLGAEGAGWQAKQQEVEDTSFIDKAQAAFTQNTFTGAAMQWALRPDYEPQPGFNLDPKRLNGMTEDEQSFMEEAVSEEHAQRIEWEIANRREDMRKINLSGTGVGIAATLFAGAPEGVLTGMGAMRAMSLARVGALQLAAEGRMGAAAASSLAENVGSNLALTAVQDKFDPYVGAADYAMAVGGGLLGFGLSLPGLKADAGALYQRGLDLQDRSAAETLALREQALKNLGEEASPERLQAEVQRLEANKLREQLEVGKVGDDRQMLGNLDEKAERIATERAEAEAAAAKVEAEQAKVQVESAELFHRERGVLNGEFGSETINAGKRQGETVEPVKGVRTYLQELIDRHTEGTPFRALAERLMGQIKDDIPVLELNQTEIKARGRGAVRSHYDTENHTIYLQSGKGRGAATDATFLHELSHALTVHKLTWGLSNPNTAIGAIASQIDALLSHVRKESAGMDLDITTKYLLKDHYEFVAGIYSGDKAKGFYDLLESIKLPDDTSALSGFVNMVRRLLGLPENEVTALAKLMGLSDELAESRLNVTYGSDLSVRMAPPAVQSTDIMTNPDVRRFGLDLMPMETDMQKAEVLALRDLYKKAEAMPKVDEKRLSKLMDTAAFRGAQSIANTLLRSKNPIARMFAAEILESPSGAGGRRATASVAKYLNNQQYLGGALNDFETLYGNYRRAVGGNIVEDQFGGKTRAQFDKLVAEEIEARQAGKKTANPDQVKKAADVLEQAYERMRVAQVDAKVAGWASLPETSTGYMPHRMSPAKLRQMTSEQRRALHGALTDQFVQIEGFDLTFADKLASKYIDRVQSRALGGFDSGFGAHQVGSAEIVEDALNAMGMNPLQVKAMMERYMRGAQGHLKRRLKLDLLEEHTLGDGGKFRLLDLFETDQLTLLRNQANRVSGEVALARHGIIGKAGLKLMRRAMEFGEDGTRLDANDPAMHAFDQAAAEMLGEPFGTQSRLVDRMLLANSVARLGGMGFTQLAESINGVAHLGAARVLSSLLDFPRLRAEIKTLAAGGKVDNPIIGSLEQWRGAEFGTEAYRTILPHDRPDAVAYGHDTLTATDRLLRGGAHLQGRLSMWRSISSVQQRGMAEQIVRKAAEYIQAGKNDVNLRDMGISDELASKLRAEFGSTATFENGRLKDFDIAKMEDKAAAEEFVQAVHRGVRQIIQGNFVGESGAWAHDGMMRMLTQFRTFSLTSVEKQWARQVGNRGVPATLGIMLGAMSMAAPIYMARTYLASIGREDRDAYLDEQLSMDKIARATLNYIALSGLAGDFMDAASAVTGVGQATGGRTGAGGQSFVGNVVAPSAGLIDDAYKAIQNTKEGTDPHQLLRLLPFSRLPAVIPAINALGD